MTIEEYTLKLNYLEQIFEDEKKVLKKRFALQNNTVKVGDVVTDSMGSIKVIQVGFYFSEPPQCLYEGVILLSNGSENKKGKKRTTYQANLI